MPYRSSRLGQLVVEAPRTRRRMRSPQHSFHLSHRAFQIQPCVIAPVIPGETLKSATIQLRCVTDPIKNSIVGWWHEFLLFYVKLRDLEERAEFESMILNPEWSDDNVDTAATTTYNYTYSGAVDYVRFCLNKVVTEYFRDDDEDYSTAAGIIDNLPMCHVNKPGWMDSMAMVSDYGSAGDDVLLVDPAGVDVLYASELQAAMQQWELLRNGGVTQQTFEEFLATYGIRPQAQELHRPELLRYVRSWSYPANTVEPTTGVPTSAVSWVVTERVDKDRFFTEPGFVFGVTVVRPKMYHSAQVGALAGALNNVQDWLPAVLSDDPNSSWKEFSDAAGGGPLQAAMNEAYAIDVKDLFLYGDQFLGGITLSDTNKSMATLPDATGQRRYVDDTDIDNLFVTPATTQAIRQDGIVTLNIASSIHDTSQPSGSVA